MQPFSSWPLFLRLLIGIALALLSMVMLIVAMPPYGWWPLLLLGFVPMLVAQHRILPARFNTLASAITIGGYWGIYIPSVFGTWDSLPWFLKALPLIVGGIVLLVDSGTRRLNHTTGYRWFILQGAFVWVGIEMIRNLIPVIGTGGFNVYSFFTAPWLIQPISLTGIFGLSMLTLIICYTLGLAAIALWDRMAARWSWPLDADVTPVPTGLVRQWLTGVGVAVIAWMGVSLFLYFSPPATATVRVAAVQPATANDTARLLAGARQAAAQGAKLVVWPEGTLHYDPQVEHTTELEAFTAETGAYLVSGVGIRTLNGLRNEATVLSPTGDFLGVYGKDHPITFMGESSITRGSFPRYDTAFGPIGTIICFDLNFVDSARRVAANGAKLIAVPSNDWPALADKQVAYLLFRSIENRVATVKADTGYDSLVIDSRGNVLATQITRTVLPAVLVADVPLGTADAPAILIGDAFGWLALVGMILFIVPNPLLKVAAKPSLTRGASRT